MVLVKIVQIFSGDHIDPAVPVTIQFLQGPQLPDLGIVETGKIFRDYFQEALGFLISEKAKRI